ncbi:MAG: hypothetical protein K2N49_06345, partial [Ruminococcus sp.]|nr:hypothetical protein [Ruminococcus sp.]
SEVSNSGTEQVKIYETAEMSIYRNTTIINGKLAGKSGFHNFGDIPEETAENIYQFISTANYAEVSENQFSENENHIDIRFTGENEFLYSVTESGIVVCEHNGSRIFYRSESNVYAGILDIIARNFPYFNFSTLIEEDYGNSVAEAVSEYIDFTKRTHLSSAGDSVMFYYDGIFTAYINENGFITVEYSLSETGGIQYRFSSSPELYNKIKDITEKTDFVIVELQESKEKDKKITSEKFTAELKESLSGDCRFSYHYGESQGMWSRCLMDSEPDISSFIDEISKFEWHICDSGQYDSLMRKNVFVINNWRFGSIPMIMNEETGTVYIAEGASESGYLEALRKIIGQTDKGYIIYLLASYPASISDMQADISVSSMDKYGKFSGNGTINWNLRENTGSIVLSDNGDEIKYIRKDGEWRITGETESEGSIFYDVPAFDYTEIYHTVLGYLTDSVEYPDRMRDFSVEKIEQYKEGIFAGDGNNYKYHFIYTYGDISCICDFTVDSAGTILSLEMNTESDTQENETLKFETENIIIK